jgi:hypothetical protein
MKISRAQTLRYWGLVAVLLCALQVVASAEPIPVRYIEGTEHGFLVLRTKAGRVLAVGDLFQLVRGALFLCATVTHVVELPSFAQDCTRMHRDTRLPENSRKERLLT